jgi:hypothetical protein
MMFRKACDRCWDAGAQPQQKIKIKDIGQGKLMASVNHIEGNAMALFAIRRNQRRYRMFCTGNHRAPK